jgi:hypothetical protein
MSTRIRNSTTNDATFFRSQRWLGAAVVLLGVLAWTPASLGQLRTVVMKGDAAPGAPDGALFEQFYLPGMNDWGEVVVYGVLQEGPGGVTTDNNVGYWSDAGGPLDLVALKGDQAPGLTPGILFGSSFEVVAKITNSHDVFLATRCRQAWAA